MQVEAMQWAQDTFGAAQLGDVRRTKRLVRLAAQMLEDPEGSLPRQTQGNWSDLKGAYRLLRADGVSHEAISHPYWQRSRQLAEQEEGEVLLVPWGGVGPLAQPLPQSVGEGERGPPDSHPYHTRACDAASYMVRVPLAG